MAKQELQAEIDQNYAFFKWRLPDLMRDHRGRYALLHDKSVVGMYDTLRDAQTTGEPRETRKRLSGSCDCSMTV
jgi:hypothetical protein